MSFFIFLGLFVPLSWVVDCVGSSFQAFFFPVVFPIKREEKRRTNVDNYLLSYKSLLQLDFLYSKRGLILGSSKNNQFLLIMIFYQTHIQILNN